MDREATQNLFNEYCQKQQWEKPRLDIRRTPEGYSCMVTLSAKDPKTKELTKLDPFKIPGLQASPHQANGVGS